MDDDAAAMRSQAIKTEGGEVTREENMASLLRGGGGGKIAGGADFSPFRPSVHRAVVN